MIARFHPGLLRGTVPAPPSKSMTHRYLMGAALSGEKCTLSGVDCSEDILATIDCLRALGARVTLDGDRVTVDPADFLKAEPQELNCRESGSTLRFFIPLALCLGKTVTFRGSHRLLERPLTVYEELSKENGFDFVKEGNCLRVKGDLQSGSFTLRGDISSQFITGLLFALVYRNQQAEISVLPPFESRSYVELTLQALRRFGAEAAFTGENTLAVKPAKLHGFQGRVEGDYSNAAFLDAFNQLGGSVRLTNLLPGSLQGDRVYKAYFQELRRGTPRLDISHCPDLGPVLFALAAMLHGAEFTGTHRLKDKESDRVLAMHQELQKLGGGLIMEENSVIVPGKTLTYGGIPLDGHNDHRIVMALSVLLTRLGGSIRGAEAVRKSYPGFFADIRSLGADVELL